MKCTTPVYQRYRETLFDRYIPIASVYQKETTSGFDGKLAFAEEIKVQAKDFREEQGVKVEFWLPFEANYGNPSEYQRLHPSRAKRLEIRA